MRHWLAVWRAWFRALWERANPWCRIRRLEAAQRQLQSRLQALQEWADQQTPSPRRPFLPTPALEAALEARERQRSLALADQIWTALAGRRAGLRRVR